MKNALLCVFRQILSGAAVPEALSLMTIAPATGDINVMIIAAVILIALFLMFILWKGKRRHP